jgi:hypothetical protein
MLECWNAGMLKAEAGRSKAEGLKGPGMAAVPAFGIPGLSVLLSQRDRPT